MYPVEVGAATAVLVFSHNTHPKAGQSESLRRALDQIWPMTQQINKFYLWV